MASKLITNHYKVTKKTKDVGKPVSPAPKESLDSDEKSEFQKLREFDMDWRYGPCIGLSRLERWERAEKHGMDPPEEIRQLVLQNLTNETYTQCVWNDYSL